MTTLYAGPLVPRDGDGQGLKGHFHGDDILAGGLVVPSQSSSCNRDSCSCLRSRVYPPQHDCPRAALPPSFVRVPPLCCLEKDLYFILTKAAFSL